MPPEIETAETGETPASAAPPSSPAPSTDEPFDAARAMATISKLREFEKTAKAQAKELDDLRRLKAERDEAELSEKDRAEKRAADAQARAKQLEGNLKDTVTKYEVRLQAQRLGYVDDDLAYLLVAQRGRLEYDADGAPTNVEAELKAILKDRPYLSKPDGDTAPQGQQRGLPATPRPARNAQPADAVAAAEQSYRNGAGGVRYGRL